MGAVGGAVAQGVNLVQGIRNQRNQERAARRAGRNQERVTQEQLGQIRELDPLLGSMGTAAGRLVEPIGQDALDSYRRAREYDPAAETEGAMREYDAASRDTLQRDLGEARLSTQERGFLAGNASSDTQGAIRSVLGGRARERSSFLANARFGERGRKEAVTGAASDRLNRAFGMVSPVSARLGAAGALGGVAGSYGQQQQFHSAQAGQFDPTSSIAGVAGSIRGIRFGPRGGGGIGTGSHTSSGGVGQTPIRRA